MSVSPVVSVQLDASASAVSVSLPSQVTDTTPILMFTCTKPSFFDASGLKYNVIKDAKGVITDIQAIASNNILDAHVLSRASGLNTAWINSSINNNIADVNCNFNGINRVFKFDIQNANSLVSTNRLGQHLMLIATHALNIQRPSTITQLFSTTQITSAALTLETQFATLLTSVLSTQTAQQAILNRIIETNGPVIGDTSGNLPYLSSYSDIDFTVTLNNVKFSVLYPKLTRELVLGNIKVRVRVV